MKEMKERDKKRFDHADMNGDGTLSKEELNMMLHPEEYPHMMAWTVQVGTELQWGWVGVSDARRRANASL